MIISDLSNANEQMHKVNVPGLQFGSNTFGGRPRGGGAEPPGAREFSKIFKTIFKKIAKPHSFGIFFKKLQFLRQFYAPLNEKQKKVG